MSKWLPCIVHNQDIALLQEALPDDVTNRAYEFCSCVWRLRPPRRHRPCSWGQGCENRHRHPASKSLSSNKDYPDHWAKQRKLSMPVTDFTRSWLFTDRSFRAPSPIARSNWCGTMCASSKNLTLTGSTVLIKTKKSAYRIMFPVPPPKKWKKLRSQQSTTFQTVSLAEQKSLHPTFMAGLTRRILVMLIAPTYFPGPAPPEPVQSIELQHLHEHINILLPFEQALQKRFADFQSKFPFESVLVFSEHQSRITSSIPSHQRTNLSDLGWWEPHPAKTSPPNWWLIRSCWLCLREWEREQRSCRTHCLLWKSGFRAFFAQ